VGAARTPAAIIQVIRRAARGDDIQHPQLAVDAVFGDFVAIGFGARDLLGTFGDVRRGGRIDGDASRQTQRGGQHTDRQESGHGHQQRKQLAIMRHPPFP